MAAFIHQENRPLKKPKLGCPDVYPQDPQQKEDELTPHNVKQGFNNHPTFPDEYGTARFSHINQNKFGAYFSAIVAEKQKVNTFNPDTAKKKQQVTKDNYWLVTPTTKSRSALQAWFHDLAGSKPLMHLAKKVPMFNKKEENLIFSTLCDYTVPMVRAAWYLKMTAALSATMAETKTMKRRAPIDPSLEYCQILTKFLKEQLTRVTEYHHTLAQAANTAAQAGFCAPTLPIPPPDVEKAIKLWQFTTKLTRYIYQEGMLECHEFLSWLVEVMEKIKAHDDNTLRFVMPLVTQFLEEFVKSQMLSRRLAYVCARRLMAMFNEACTGSPRSNSPHANSAGMHSGQPSQPHTLATVFAEYTNCPQHRAIIIGLSCILQTITLRCASALVWINVGESKSTSVPGSPLDILPCAASQLPLPGPPSLHHHQIRATLRHAEHQIKLRSRAAEVRWSSDKCQESTAGHTINGVLHTLEVLDRHCFDRVDANNSLDALYNKIFCGPQNKDANEFPLTDDPTILLLCEWAVCPQRSGEDRALVVAHLLERRFMDLETEKDMDVTGEQTSVIGGGGEEKDQAPPTPGIMPQPPAPSLPPMPLATPMFQGLLLHFLDTQAPVCGENSTAEERRAFANLVLLFSELIRRDVFSHDAYMCTLISRGDIANTVPPTLQASAPPSVEQPGSVRDKADTPVIKEEPKDEMEIKQEPEDDPMGDPMGGDNYNDLDIKPPAPAPRKESLSFQEKFLEAIQAKKLEPESEYFEEDNKGENSPPDKKPNISHLMNGGMSAPDAKVNRHLVFAKNFPIPQDDMSAHECNQRLVLLYGFGRARDEARHAIKKIQKEIFKLVMRGKKDTTPSPATVVEKTESPKGGKKVKVEFASNIETLRVMEKFEGLAHFDQHIVTAMVSRGLLERVEGCSKGNVEQLPAIEQITLAFDMMESALSVNQLLDFALQLLNLMNAVESELAAKSSPQAGKYTTNLCLCIVAILRRYQPCLLVSLEQTANVFELLCGVVKHVSNVTSCSSAERCILAYLYDLYTSCSHLRNKFSELFSSVASKVKQTLYTSISPSESNVMWNSEVMTDYIENPTKAFSHAVLGRQLNESPEDRYSFVCNALLRICNTTNLEQLNDISILCAELTASCNSLSSEWLGVLKALCCSSNHSCGFNDLLMRVEVNDLSIHDSIAVFTSILIARHCFSLVDVVDHVALASLIAATPSVSGGTLMDPDAEPGARLMCHLLLRLFRTSDDYTVAGSIPEVIRGDPIIKSSCNRHLLAAAHGSISIEALLAVLKSILLLGDAGVGGSNGNGMDEDHDDMPVYQSSMKGGNAATGGAASAPSNPMESASLSEYAKFTLKTICSQEWVREIFLKDPEKLWTPEVLLDEVLTCKQAQYLLQLICYPGGVPLVECANDNEQKQSITRILKTLDQWGLRVSWLELQLMLKQRSSEDGSLSSLLDNIAKATIEMFQHQGEEGVADRGSGNNGGMFGSHTSSRQQQNRRLMNTRMEQERSGVWFVAPLISKLHSSVQGRVLRAAGNVLESVGQTWSSAKSTKDKDKGKSQMSSVNHQPLLSLILTCLKGQDEQREGLLTSLQTQLTQFLQSPKDDRWEDPKSRRLMHEALQLRLSLVGNMFDTILRSYQWTTEFALLLLQLITTGTVDIHSNSELFMTVLDMLSVLINSTLNSDGGGSPGSGEEKGRQHQTLIKKLKKELGDKHSDGIDRVRQLLPVPKKSCEVVTCEPMGALVDTKGNKIAGFDSIDKKQGLQVASKQKVNPWETLEANKNPAPLSWSWFGAVRMERKPLKYQEQHRMTLYHTHGRQKDDDYFFAPPVLPPDEEEPPQPVSQEVEKPPQEVPVTAEAKVDSGPNSGPETQTQTKKPRKRPRRQKSTPSNQTMMNREPQYPFNPNMNFQDRPYLQPAQPYMQNQFPYQQPLPPAGPSRGGIPEQRSMPVAGKVALRHLLNNKQHPGQVNPMQIQDASKAGRFNNKSSADYHLMQKRQQMIKDNLRRQLQGGAGGSMDAGNNGMFPQGYKPGPQEGGPSMLHMPGGQTPVSSSYNYGNQMLPQQSQMAPDQHGGSMVPSNYNQHGYTSHAQQGQQGGMMQPMSGQPGGGYIQQQHRQMPAAARIQHQLQQRANMQQVQQAVNQPGMPQQSGQQQYMSHQMTTQDRRRQLLEEQRYMGMQRQHPNQQQHPPQQHQQQHQQTADLVRQLQNQMTRGPSMGPGQPGPQPGPQHNPYQY